MQGGACEGRLREHIVFDGTGPWRKKKGCGPLIKELTLTHHRPATHSLVIFAAKLSWTNGERAEDVQDKQ